MTKTLAAFTLLALAVSSQASSAGEPRMTARTILSTTTTATGQPISVPSNPHTIGTIVEIPVGYAPGYHKHLFSRYAYVLSGELEVQDKGNGSRIYRPGQLFVETTGSWHRPHVLGTIPVRLLVIDQIPQGATTNTVNE